MKAVTLFTIILKTIVLLFIKLFFSWFSPIKKRIKFEQKNKFDQGTHSFKSIDMQASAAFFISSEGEFEQVAALINYYLVKNELIEIIFTSPSVEKQITNLYQGNQEKIRYLRYPFLSYRFFFLENWVTAPKVFCCRYDIFPEMIMLIEKRKSILVSATTLYRLKQNFIIQSYYHFIYQLFDVLIWADKRDPLYKDQKNFVADMRSYRITERLRHSAILIKEKKLEAFVQQILEERFSTIWGSFWPNEIEAFTQKTNHKVVIAPHNLDENTISRIQQAFEKLGYKTALVDSGYEKMKADIYILTVKGVLCEFYQYFNHAIIGGGHSKSIHSVLEPYLAGCMVWHGPVYYRSTEHKYINNQDTKRIHVIESLADYFVSIDKVDYQNSADDYTSDKGQDILSYLHGF